MIRLRRYMDDNGIVFVFAGGAEFRVHRVCRLHRFFVNVILSDLKFDECRYDVGSLRRISRALALGTKVALKQNALGVLSVQVYTQVSSLIVTHVDHDFHGRREPNHVCRVHVPPSHRRITRECLHLNTFASWKTQEINANAVQR